jgi:cellobiose phosphorylase
MQGSFNDAGDEYLITDPRGTKRPWLNYCYNDEYYINVDPYGRSMGQYQDGKGQWALTAIEGTEYAGFSGSKGFYLRDNDTGEIWDAAWVFTQRPFSRLQTRVRPGSTIIESEYNGIAMRWRIFVPVQDPIELWTLDIENRGRTARSLSVFPFARIALTGFSFPHGSSAGDYNSFLKGTLLKGHRAVLCENLNPYITIDKYNAVLMADREPDAYETMEEHFLGATRTFAFPKAVLAGQLAGGESRGNNMLAALQFNLTLPPGKAWQVNTGLAATGVKDKQYLALIAHYAAPGAVEKEFTKRQEWEQRMQQSFTLDTPDADVNRMANIWVKKQLGYCIRFSRGWGKGYRDTLQDAQFYRFIENDPAWAGRQFAKYRETLASALTHQYADGRGTRKWSPVSKENYSDAPAWLIDAGVDYIKETGDADFLNQVVPYFDHGSATVWEHLLQAARQMAGDRGAHRMVRISGGDWNDGITGAGEQGRGESVMNTQMLCNGLRELDALRQRYHLPALDAFSKNLTALADEIAHDLNTQAWDGNWYVRAFDDSGRKIGSHENKEGQIYIESQAFALMAGIADADRRQKVMDSVAKHLEVDYGLRLLAPSYTAFNPEVGRITAHIPGIWENGAVYCHGTAFFMIGLCRSGCPDQALALFHKLLGTNPLHPSEKSGLEPYILTNCFNGPDNEAQPGFARRSWTTGTAAWVTRYLAESLGGIFSDYDGLKLAPCLPSEWERFRQQRWFRNRHFDITIHKSHGPQGKVLRASLNGKPLTDPGFIPLTACQERNVVDVMCE